MEKKFIKYDYRNNENLTIESDRHTDFYFSETDRHLSGEFIYQNCEKNFTIIAEVCPNCSQIYDAAGIMVWGTDNTWTKFVIEKIDEESLNVVSMVTNEFSDDVVGERFKGKAIFLKIEAKNNFFQFSYSHDDKLYIKHRKFYLKLPDVLKLGFISQSPNGDRTRAEIKIIGFSHNKI